MQNGKENHRISKLNKEQLTRYIQALSKTVTHTTHTTHTFFHLLTPSFSFILPSLALFFFQRLANVSVRACVQLPRDHKGGTVSWRKRACTHPSWVGAACSPGCPSRPSRRPSGPAWWSRRWSSNLLWVTVQRTTSTQTCKNKIASQIGSALEQQQKKSQSDYVFWLFVVTDQMDAIHEVTCWMQHKPHYTILPQYKNVQWTCRIHFVNVFKCVKCVGQLPRNGKIPQNECQNSFQKIGHLWCHREDDYYYIFQVRGNKNQVLFFLTIFCFTLLCFAALTLTLNN